MNWRWYHIFFFIVFDFLKYLCSWCRVCFRLLFLNILWISDLILWHVLILSHLIHPISFRIVGFHCLKLPYEFLLHNSYLFLNLRLNILETWMLELQRGRFQTCSWEFSQGLFGLHYYLRGTLLNCSFLFNRTFRIKIRVVLIHWVDFLFSGEIWALSSIGVLFTIIIENYLLLQGLYDIY